MSFGHFRRETWTREQKRAPSSERTARYVRGFKPHVRGFKPLLRLRRCWCVLLVLPAVLLTSLAAGNPEATESLYSTWIYPVLSGVFGRISGALPFSLAQWVVILLPPALLAYIIVSLRKKNTARLVSTLLCLAGIILFAFTAVCGLNYHRTSFADCAGLEVRSSSPEELAELCGELVELTNHYSAKVARDSDGVTVSSFADYYDMASFASGAYATAGEKYPVLAGFYPKPKPVLFSRVMSAIDLVGIYFPFTFEANVNTDVPDYSIPSSMLHELAHFKGFMREDEANFIAYLGCVSSGNDDFTYSGSVMALRYSINALYSSDRDAYWEVVENLDGAVRRDFQANADYWSQFEGPVAEAAEKVNDVYLKTNRQPDGVKSYGRMVDLLLAEYRQRHGLTD